MRQLHDDLDKEKILDKTSNQGIEWRFSPPVGPHHGGVHESMIKSAKRAIYAILTNAEVTDEELNSAFIGAEATINTRPLTYQSSHENDLIPLTPNDFLHGMADVEIEPRIDDAPPDHARRWRRIQELLANMWRRWVREWIPSLSGRRTWRKEQPDASVGDVVIVVCEGAPRGRWPLGRIVDVRKGRDGHIRVVKVQSEGTILTRPITKLCPLIKTEKND